ncbi:SDR family oxidoreductase [bacterium]|nr:SDR family oxidoreductase [bacterium]
MPYNFKNKKILVTGGSRGIGAAIVDAYLKCGAEVTYTGQKKAQNPNPSAKFLQLDFSNDASIESFLSSAEIEKFDVLVNNAGINKIDHFHEIQLEDFKQIQKVNVEGPFRLSQAVVKGMLKRNFGRIVNVGSIFSTISKEKRASYSTSKFALVGMTKAMAIEYASKNILVNVISPGFIDTELTRQILSETQIAELTSQVPIKRLGTPAEVAEAVLFLTSPENTLITGQNIVADGGFTCV